MIESLVPGGLEAFQAMGRQRKAGWRGRVIQEIKKDAFANEKMAIVSAHFMFWPEEQATGHPVYVLSDLDVFTHIIYLNTPAECILQRRSVDKLKYQPAVAVEHLRKWQEDELNRPRLVCSQSDILLHVLTDPESMCEKATLVIEYLCFITPGRVNDQAVIEELNNMCHYSGGEQLETALVLDADKTLTSVDTDFLFWEAVHQIRPPSTRTSPVKGIFAGRLDYSPNAFHRATLLYEGAADDDEYDSLCETVASSVTIYSEALTLLRVAAARPHILVVVVTHRLARVWEKVLRRHDLSGRVRVLGGGRISDGNRNYLRKDWNLHAWAFGEGALDFLMLKAANEAKIVVGHERDGTSSAGFISAMETIASCWFNKATLPVARLGDPDFVNSVLRHRFEMVHATEKGAAKLLLSSMRAASAAGPVLRAVHKSIGAYLALEFVSELIGLEDHPITDVQEHQLGHCRLRDEQRTSIVAITRKGEPIACGLSEVFPSIMFILVASMARINHDDLQHQRTVILVDSAINDGQTMMEFIEQIRKFHPQIRIVVVAGIVHPKVTERTHHLNKMMRRSGASLVALRVSEEDFTGTGSTETDNRLLTARPEMDLS
ncbi:Hypothetical protein NCS54_01235200 [Fusarium falciforme]|uniref:Hypothetical protein n=1 Tax=Fusarium falciforme TaxID=195108 RepID=UPI0023010177|nr:Hypothetical protein NCS54_01235200 [Fusarium falciforme]WAO94754.1 Hypothetical protein NCS54_01235200 [Fusarium falciforme]